MSDAAFRLFKNPRYHYRPPIVLPPHLLYGMENLSIWCAIMINDKLVTFHMSAHPETSVNGFKKGIKLEMDPGLRDVPAATLVLRKVSII
jgi:hypothetical protein